MDAEVSPPEADSEGPRSILIVKPSSFGDIIHTLPAVARIKATWPNAKIAWVVNGEWQPLLAGNRDVDEVVPFPRQKFRGLTGAMKFRRWCRDQLSHRKPDLAIDFQGLLRSAWLIRAAQPVYSVGMRDAREGARWFYDYCASIPTGVPHAVERYLATANEAIRHYHPNSRRPVDCGPSFPIPAGELLDERVVAVPDRFIMLHPFARGRGKSLSETQIQSLCRELSPQRVILVGRRPADTQLSWPVNCVDLLNLTSLPQLIRLVRLATAVVTVDSGPSHLAAALGRSMIAIHRWSDPRRVGPYRPEAWVWKNGSLLQMQQLAALDERFFSQPPRALVTNDLSTIAKLTTSFLDSSA